MAGSRAKRTRRVRPAVRLAVLFLALGEMAGAQGPESSDPAPPVDAQAQDHSSLSPPDGTPAASPPHLDDVPDSPGAMLGPTAAPRPWYFRGPGTTSTAIRLETGLFDTITESVFGEPDRNSWRPLPFRTFFSEGWSEAWVPSPKGSGGAPRQAWINAATSHLSRGEFFTFAYGANAPPKSGAYLGSYTLMTPLSRRLMLITNVPFVLRNNAESGQPIISPPGPSMMTSRSHTGFGDVSFTPRVLLHETKDVSLTAELAVLTPTGDRPLARKSTLTPAIGFWTNFADGWVVRGGIGDRVATQGGGSTLISQLAVGRTLTEHDMPLVGDFTLYLSAVGNTPLSDGGRTSVTLTPGIRTHVGHDWYILAGLPTPLTKARVADLGMVLWIVKAW